MRDKLQGGEIQVNNRFTRWAENFWYHYKWHTIAAMFVLFAVVVCSVQMCSKEEADVNVLYAGFYSFEQQDSTPLAQAVASLLPKDYNGDGRKEVSVASLLVYSTEQIQAAQAEAEANGDTLTINTAFFAQEQQKFSQLLMSGEYYIVLAEDWLYEQAKETGIFLPLVDALGEKPENAYDDCAMRLCDTGFGQYFTAVQELPKETLICFRRQDALTSLLHQDKAEEDYLKALEVFRALMAFEA